MRFLRSSKLFALPAHPLQWLGALEKVTDAGGLRVGTASTAQVLRSVWRRSIQWRQLSDAEQQRSVAVFFNTFFPMFRNLATTARR